MKKYIGFSIIALGLTMTSCDDWLDKLPDNRMELQSPSDISSLLVSAYPNVHPAYLLEMYSDNTDECIKVIEETIFESTCNSLEEDWDGN